MYYYTPIHKYIYIYIYIYIFIYFFTNIHTHTDMQKDVMTASSFGCQQAGSSAYGGGHFALDMYSVFLKSFDALGRCDPPSQD